MWVMISWVAVLAWTAIALFTFIRLRSANGNMPIQTRVMNSVLLLLFTALAGTNLFAASTQDSFQALLSFAIEKRAIILDPDDRIGFIWWRGFHRAQHILAIITAVLYIPFTFWEIDLWQRNRTANEGETE